MKNKRLTYFLIAAVAGVWSLFIYRIIVAAKSDDDALPIAIATTKESYNDYAIARDTTKLLLNYRDPFGLVSQKDTINIRKSKLTPYAKSAAPGINWAFIIYSGYIKNPVSRKLVTLITINGQSFALNEGEAREQVKLLKNRRDSIEVSYLGKTKFIVKK